MRLQRSLNSTSSRNAAILPAALFVIAVLSRLPFTSRLLFSLDSVQFALGMDDYNIGLHQPHPPGYFIYVQLARLARLLFPDANTAMISISVLSGALTIVLIYRLALDIYDEHTAFAASVLALTSPVVWFHGEVALTYMPEAMMSVLVAWLCYRLLRGESGFIIPAAVALAMAGGIRQNSMVFLLPLWIYSMKGMGTRRIILGLSVLGLSFLAWFIPMVYITGGYERYKALMDSQLYFVLGGYSTKRILLDALYMSYFLTAGLTLSLAPLVLWLYKHISSRTQLGKPSELTVFFLLWLLPGILFHIYVFFQPAAPGYILIYLVGILILAGRSVTSISESLSSMLKSVSPGKLGTALSLVLALANTVFFMFSPFPPSRKLIADSDKTMAAVMDTVKANFPADKTCLIGSGSFVLSFRHAMYYLPEFSVYDTGYHDTVEGDRIFWGRNGITHEAKCISVTPDMEYLVDFYLAQPKDKSKLPKGASYICTTVEGVCVVYYRDPAALLKVRRIAPAVKLSLKGR